MQESNRDDRVIHTPVMVEEVLRELQVRPDGLYVDGTLGDGGHAEAVLRAGGRVIGLDRDPDALAIARARLKEFENRFDFAHAAYADLPEVLAARKIERVDGVLLDLGLSSRQLEASGRGFSFVGDQPLDMRFDPSAGQPAAWAVNNLSRDELAEVFYRYGEERLSRPIARAVIERRPLRTTADLVRAVESVTGPRRPGKIHPATRVFQALRIYVNQELEELQAGLQAALGALAPGGRLVVISYHSLEDKIVKETLQTEATACICPPRMPVCVCGHRARVMLPVRKPLVPKSDEVERNPRSRSARLRVAVCI